MTCREPLDISNDDKDGSCVRRAARLERHERPNQDVLFSFFFFVVDDGGRGGFFGDHHGGRGGGRHGAHRL